MRGRQPHQQKQVNVSNGVQRESPSQDVSRDTSHSSTSATLILKDVIKCTLPTKARLSVVNQCLECLRELVSCFLGKGNYVVLQGSYAQGLALDGSDLDIAVVTAGQGAAEVEKRVAVRQLELMASRLHGASSKQIRVMYKVFSARVPILRLMYCAEGGKVMVDMSIGGTTRGVCDRYVHKLLSQDTSGIAPALCRAVKIWAKGKHITDTKRGGLSNFALVLLSTFFLQQPLPECPPLLPSYEHIVTKNIEWKEEIWKGPCPLQLGTLVCVKGNQIVRLLAPFYEWASKGMPCPNRTKSNIGL